MAFTTTRCRMPGNGACALLLLMCAAIPRPATAQARTPDPCVGPGAETTAGVRLCLRERLRRAEAGLDSLLRAARRQAQDTMVLDSAQAAWRAYVQRDCSAAADVYRGGSLAPVVALGCRLDHTRLRQRHLRGDYLSNDSVPPGKRWP